MAESDTEVSEGACGCVCECVHIGLRDEIKREERKKELAYMNFFLKCRGSKLVFKILSLD